MLLIKTTNCLEHTDLVNLHGKPNKSFELLNPFGSPEQAGNLGLKNKTLSLNAGHE